MPAGLVAELAGDVYPVCLFLAVNRQGDVFLWPCKLPGADGRSNTWNESALAAARLAEAKWVRVAANMNAGCTTRSRPRASCPRRRGPSCLLRSPEAVLQGPVHSSVDHPAIRACGGGVIAPCATTPRSGCVTSSSAHQTASGPLRFAWWLGSCARGARFGNGRTGWLPWAGRPSRSAPILFVAYYASAELGCFRALDWPAPVRVLDLFCEFRYLTNGVGTVAGNGLLGAMAYFGLPSIDAAEKEGMRNLIQRPGPYMESERPPSWPTVRRTWWPWRSCCRPCSPSSTCPGPCCGADLHGRRGGDGVQRRAHRCDHLAALRSHWEAVKGRLVERIDSAYGVYATAEQALATRGGPPFHAPRPSFSASAVCRVAVAKAWLGRGWIRGP